MADRSQVTLAALWHQNRHDRISAVADSTSVRVCPFRAKHKIIGYRREHRVEAAVSKESTSASLIIRAENSSASGCRSSLETNCARKIVIDSIN